MALVIRLKIYLVSRLLLKTYIHLNYVSSNLIANINQRVFVFFFARRVLFCASCALSKYSQIYQALLKYLSLNISVCLSLCF